MVTEIKNLEDKIGTEKFKETLEKDWKTADLPSEEELAAEEHDSPKARSNPNSRKNLSQYQKKKSPKAKKAALDNLAFEKTEEDVDPRDILDPTINLDMLLGLLPANTILASRAEQTTYWSNINLFLKDFDADELTASDIDDVLTLALNRVLEIRLLSLVREKNNPKLLVDVSNTIDKWKRQNEKIKSGLASRRVDRVDVINKTSFSIVDLAASIDEEKMMKFEERSKLLHRQEEAYLLEKKIRGSEEG